ncbi:unnamed protein product [Withania somnifera]
MDILTKVALNQGMSNYVFVVYRHAVATLIIAPFAIILDKPVIDQNLYSIGLKYTTATFIHSQAKIVGTVATVAGAMIMTLVRGPIVELFWTKGTASSIMITIGCFSWAAFMILQAITLQTYPADLSLTAWICFLGTTEGAIVAMVMERGKTAGVFCSGLAYYIQGVIMKDRGPVFVTAFNPLGMIIVAILSTIILHEQLCLGRVLGAIVIVVDLYIVLWGKSKDHKSSSIDEQATPTQEMTHETKIDKENLSQTVIHINTSRGTTDTKDESI